MGIKVYPFWGAREPGSGGGSADARPVALDGPLSLYVGQSAQWQITDFDAFSEYLVQVDAGVASLDGDTISYTAPASAGEVTLIITVNGVPRSLAVEVLPPSIAPPALIAPTDGATGLPERPTLASAAFAVFGGTDTHLASRWRIWSADGQTLIYDSGPTADLTAHVVPFGVLQPSTAYRIEVAHQGQSLGWSEYGARITITTSAAFAKIIGLVCVATGGGAGTWQRIDGNFQSVTPDASYFNNHPVYAAIVDQTIDGQVMRKIPKFWFRAGAVPSGAHAGKTYWQISDQAVDGFAVHPAFADGAGGWRDQVWVGKYQGTNDGGTKLGSQPGVMPLVSIDFPTAQARAAARNTGGVTGFRLWWGDLVAAIQLLMSIEIGGTDGQSLIGQGRVSASSAANTDASDVAQATWRGIVGLWGNVWQMVDGLKRNGGKWQMWTPGTQTYVDTGQADLQTSGYPVTFNASLLSARGVILPATVNATASNGTTGDYFYSNTSTDDRIAYHGGNWGGGALAGPFCLDVPSAPSSSFPSFGARLAKV
ncbi:MAG: hypothetical protein MZV65_43675 [Chromatiales bacterium]|nr:hypothetical protein [Chromatiales bacterium]